MIEQIPNSCRAQGLHWFCGMDRAKAADALAFFFSLVQLSWGIAFGLYDTRGKKFGKRLLLGGRYDPNRSSASIDGTSPDCFAAGIRKNQQMIIL